MRVPPETRALAEEWQQGGLWSETMPFRHGRSLIRLGISSKRRKASARRAQLSTPGGSGHVQASQEGAQMLQLAQGRKHGSRRQAGCMSLLLNAWIHFTERRLQGQPCTAFPYACPLTFRIMQHPSDRPPKVLFPSQQHCPRASVCISAPDSSPLDAVCGAESHRPSLSRGASGGGPGTWTRLSKPTAAKPGAHQCRMQQPHGGKEPETQAHGPSAHRLPLNLKACVGTSTQLTAIPATHCRVQGEKAFVVPTAVWFPTSMVRGTANRGLHISSSP